MFGGNKQRSWMFWKMMHLMFRLASLQKTGLILTQVIIKRAIIFFMRQGGKTSIIFCRNIFGLELKLNHPRSNGGPIEFFTADCEEIRAPVHRLFRQAAAEFKAIDDIGLSCS